MTREERIEAAARAIAPWSFDSPILGDPELANDRALARAQAKAALEAAFPELMSDPPAAWVAPMDDPEDMRHDLAVWANDFQHDTGLGCAGIWRKIRDAYTKEQT